MDPKADEKRRRAILLAAETMGELIEFWGFKGSMGRIWATLYLSSAPLSADQIAERTGLSAGAVSMTLAELQQWDLVERAAMPEERKKHYQAETDVWGMVRRIFRERELRLIGRAVQRFGDAVALMNEARALDPDDSESQFVVGRLEGLLSLARTGYRMVETFAEIGQFTLDPIRGVLSAFSRTPRA